MDVQPIDPAAIDLPATKPIDMTAYLREALVVDAARPAFTDDGR